MELNNCNKTYVWSIAVVQSNGLLQYSWGHLGEVIATVLSFQQGECLLYRANQVVFIYKNYLTNVRFMGSKILSLIGKQIVYVDF